MYSLVNVARFSWNDIVGVVTNQIKEYEDCIYEILIEKDDETFDIVVKLLTDTPIEHLKALGDSLYGSYKNIIFPNGDGTYNTFEEVVETNDIFQIRLLLDEVIVYIESELDFPIQDIFMTDNCVYFFPMEDIINKPMFSNTVYLN